MYPLVECLNMQGHQIIFLLGSGGKTSMMWYLAQCYKQKQERVLISTTTKIGYPSQAIYDFLSTDNFSSLIHAKSGITVAGSSCHDGQKLTMPADPLFRESFSHFDKVFLEADGSKQLPLKGWAAFEPVILPETTVSIGLLPISVIGKVVNEQIIHRLPLFLKCTDTKKDDLVSVQTLIDIITAPSGLFAKRQSVCILCLNQVDSKEKLTQARQLVSLLPKIWLEKMLTKIIACNVQSKEGIILWEK